MTVTKTTKEKLFVPFSVLTIAVFVSQKAMQEERHTSLVRPLLVLNRYQTKKLCQLWKMPVYPDQTNRELVFTRNRVRKQLLPILRSFFNPQIDAVLSHLSEAVLLEWLHGEFLLGKLGRNTGDWNRLQPIYQILQFWQTKGVAQQHHVNVHPPPRWPVVAFEPHVHNVLRSDRIVESNTAPVLSDFPRHRDTRLDYQRVAQNTHFEPFRVSSLLNSANEKVLNQFPRPLGECLANGDIQVRRPLVASLKKRCRLDGRRWPWSRKPLPTKMVSLLSKTQLSRSSSLDLERDRALCERATLSAYCRENTIDDCLSLRYKDILSYQPARSVLRTCSMRCHYFDFPKFGCFVTLGTTLYFRNRV